MWTFLVIEKDRLAVKGGVAWKLENADTISESKMVASENLLMMTLLVRSWLKTKFGVFLLFHPSKTQPIEMGYSWWALSRCLKEDKQNLGTCSNSNPLAPRRHPVYHFQMRHTWTRTRKHKGESQDLWARWSNKLRHNQDVALWYD